MGMDTVEPVGLVSTARRTDALVCGTVEEHRFTPLAEPPRLFVLAFSFLL